MRCEQCSMIPFVEIHNPNEYIMCLNSLIKMVKKGEVEMTYETCPLDKVLDDDAKFYAEKMFHQFRCTKCGTLYGMFVNATCGGEIKLNDKVFNPDDFDKKEEK